MKTAIIPSSHIMNIVLVSIYTKSMKPKKASKPTKKDKTWQEKVEKQLKIEKIALGHPQGKEKFERIVKKIIKKKET
jgi:hypothetical protein